MAPGSALLTALGGGIFGLVVGSWLTAVAHRLPRRLDLISDRSRCPSCATQISSRDNVPLLGWMMLRGRCRSCAARIPARYPAIELAGGIIGALAALWNWPVAVMAALALLIIPSLISLGTRTRSASR